MLTRPLRASAVLLLSALALLPVSTASAQAWPDKPVHVVVPYAPGGLGDVLARNIGKHMSEALGQPVLIENKPGAAGMLGASLVAKAPADGYTVLLGYTSEMTVAPLLTRDAAYDTVRDFEPVALAGTSPLLLVAHPSVPGTTLQDFVDAARGAPDRFAYASAGNGSPAHFAGELLRRSANIGLLHVPYKGGAQAVADVLAGNVHVYFSGFPPALPQVRAGKLKALAVTGKQRSPALPQVPTLEEAGLRDFDLSGWFGYFVPRGTPAPVVKRLNDVIVAAVMKPELQAALASQGVELAPGSPSAFKSFVTAEQRKYRDLIGTLGIQP